MWSVLVRIWVAPITLDASGTSDEYVFGTRLLRVMVPVGGPVSRIVGSPGAISGGSRASSRASLPGMQISAMSKDTFQRSRIHATAVPTIARIGVRVAASHGETGLVGLLGLPAGQGQDE